MEFHVSSCQSLVSLLSVSCQSLASLLPVSCQSLVSLLPVSCQSLASLLPVSCQSLASQRSVIHGNKSVVSLRARFWDLDGSNIPPRTVQRGQRTFTVRAPLHFSRGLEDVQITRMKANPSLLLERVVPAFGLTRLTFHAALRVGETLLDAVDAGNKDDRQCIVAFGFSALVALAKVPLIAAAVEMGLVAHGTQTICIKANQVETHDARERGLCLFERGSDEPRQVCDPGGNQFCF